MDNQADDVCDTIDEHNTHNNTSDHIYSATTNEQHPQESSKQKRSTTGNSMTSNNPEEMTKNVSIHLLM
jgi:hypothetical protein